MKNLISTLLVGLLASLSLFGQFDSAAVLGTVRDSSGAAMGNAQLTLTNIKTGIAQSAVSDQDGNFQILNVPIGTYRLCGRGARLQEVDRERVSLSL
jgi:hypothetical protein